MQLVRKAMETSRTDEQPCQDSSTEEDSEDTDEEEDKENEMQVDNNQRDGK